jgi:hypothetical protein
MIIFQMGDISDVKDSGMPDFILFEMHHMKNASAEKCIRNKMHH